MLYLSCCVRRQSISPDNLEDSTVIDIQEPVALEVDVRYLTFFAKAMSLSPVVRTSPVLGCCCR